MEVFAYPELEITVLNHRTLGGLSLNISKYFIYSMDPAKVTSNAVNTEIWGFLNME